MMEVQLAPSASLKKIKKAPKFNKTYDNNMESVDVIKLYTDFADEIQEARNKRKESKDGFNLFSALVDKKTHLEIYHSNFLAYLLGPENDHDCNHVFQKTFLEMIMKKIMVKHVDHPVVGFIIRWLKDDLGNSTVIKEKPVQSGRIDIEISGTKNRKIFLENKIRSTEGKGQLLNYFDHYHNNSQPGNFIGIYLTKDGSEAISLKNNKNANEAVISLSYYDILEWLSFCVEKEFKNSPNVSFSILQYTKELKKELGMINDLLINELQNKLSNDPSALLKIVSCQQSINDTITQIVIKKRSLFLSLLLDHIGKQLSNHQVLAVKDQNIKKFEKEGSIDIVNKNTGVEFSLYIKNSFPEFEDGGKGLWWGIYNIENNTPFQGLKLKNNHWEGIKLNSKINDFEDDVAGSLLIIESESSAETKQQILGYVSSYIIDHLSCINPTVS